MYKLMRFSVLFFHSKSFAIQSVFVTDDVTPFGLATSQALSNRIRSGYHAGEQGSGALENHNLGITGVMSGSTERSALSSEPCLRLE